MRNRAIRAVIFDQDGLMFDTERLSVEAWNMVGAECGICMDEDFLSTIRGMNIRDAAEQFNAVFGDRLDFISFRQKKQECFEQILRERGVPVKPGLLELLTFLRENGYKTALATASTKDYTQYNLKATGTEQYFDYMITGDMVVHAKPDPEVFIKSAEALGELPEHCMVLEDSINGVEAGISGGFFTVMVPDITKPDEELCGRVDRVCQSLLEVKEMLEGVS